MNKQKGPWIKASSFVFDDVEANCDVEAGPSPERVCRADTEAARGRDFRNCVICHERFERSSMVICSVGEHAVCKSCFQQYVDVEMQNDIQQLRCPLWPSHAGGCRGLFSQETIARMFSSESNTVSLVDKYFKWREKQIRSQEYKNSHAVLDQIVAALSKAMPHLNQEIIERQLREAVPNARQCGSCGFGPVEHFACGNLETHQGQRVGRAAIQNKCPHCGWFASNINQWPKWNGKLHSAARSLTELNVDFTDIIQSTRNPSSPFDHIPQVGALYRTRTSGFGLLRYIMPSCIYPITDERLANYISREEQSRISQIERDAEYARQLSRQR
jgi:hypothetical protein